MFDIDHGVESVEDQGTGQPLEAGGPDFRKQLLKTELENRVTDYPGGGSVDGKRGDHVRITPPLTVTRADVDEMMDRLHGTFGDVGDVLGRRAAGVRRSGVACERR